MLPVQMRNNKNEAAFDKLFREKRIEQAKILLTDALNSAEDSEVKVEIERRLKLLEPKTVSEIKCNGCGKLFLPRRIRRFKNNFCEDCMKKKFGSRD
jgi:formylmethanofuran dehydrogenase subunit E